MDSPFGCQAQLPNLSRRSLRTIHEYNQRKHTPDQLVGKSRKRTLFYESR